MSIKLALLKSGETVISDMKELLSKEVIPQKVIAYMLKKPHIVFIQKEVFLTEEMEQKKSNQKEVQVVFSDWFPLSKEEEMVIPADWVVTMTDPLDSVKELYEEKTNGQSN